LIQENLYPCGHGCNYWDLKLEINPGVTHPPDCGASSIGGSPKNFFLVLAEEWPKLKKLSLIEMGETEDVAEAIRHLQA
jgi:hypothetical protein